MPKRFCSDYDAALALAAITHQPKCRKESCIPYIVHPIHVARILELHSYPKHVVLAGLLHDVLEDTDYRNPQIIHALRSTFDFFANLLFGNPTAADVEKTLITFIGERFGGDVLALVKLVTSRHSDSPHRPWRERKAEQMAHLDNISEEHAALKGADLLHNMETMTANLAISGQAALSCFDSENSLVDVPWYYCGSGEKVVAVLGRSNPLAGELLDVMARLRTLLSRP